MTARVWVIAEDNLAAALRRAHVEDPELVMTELLANSSAAGVPRSERPMPPDRPAYDDRVDELVVPFVCVASEGGPFDDFAFAAGCQLGALDQRLDRASLCAMTELVYEQLEEQCDLVAMHHGFTMDVLGRVDGWVHIGFKRALIEEVPT